MITAIQRTRFEAREKRERETMATANALLTEMIRTFDSGGWAIDQRDYMRYIVKGDEEILTRLDKDKRRLTFHGCTPRLPDGMSYRQREDGGSASVSIDRKPEAVARDIERRLLPTLRADLEKQAATVAEWVEHQESRESLADFVADVLGRPIDANRYGKRGDDLTISIGHPRGKIRGSAKVSYGKRVTFDLTVSGRENVAKVAAVIAEIIQGGD